MKNELTYAWNEAEALYYENEALKKELKKVKSDLEYADDLGQERYIAIWKLKKEIRFKRKCIHFLLILILLIVLGFGAFEVQKSVSVSNAQSSTISTTSHKN